MIWVFVLSSFFWIEVTCVRPVPVSMEDEMDFKLRFGADKVSFQT